MCVNVHTLMDTEREREDLKNKSKYLKPQHIKQSYSLPLSLSLNHKSTRSNSEESLNPIKLFISFNCVSGEGKKQRVQEKKNRERGLGVVGSFFVWFLSEERERIAPIHGNRRLFKTEQQQSGKKSYNTLVSSAHFVTEMPKPLLLFVNPISIKIAGLSETEKILAFCTLTTKTSHFKCIFLLHLSQTSTDVLHPQSSQNV